MPTKRTTSIQLTPKRRLARLSDVPSCYPISVSSLRRSIASGDLKAYRVRRSIYVDLDEVDALFRVLPSADPSTWCS